MIPSLCIAFDFSNDKVCPQVIKRSKPNEHAHPAMIFYRGSICRGRIDVYGQGVRTKAIPRPINSLDPHTCVSTSEQSTAQLAALFAKELQAGDCYKLNGAVGAGKSVFRWGWISRVQGSKNHAFCTYTCLCTDHAQGTWFVQFLRGCSFMQGYFAVV